MTLPKQKYETKTELRELLSNLLKNCLEISAWDSLSYNRRFSTSPCPDKPFADIFKKYRKKEQQWYFIWSSVDKSKRKRIKGKV